jgi:hypothetical protein
MRIFRFRFIAAAVWAFAVASCPSFSADSTRAGAEKPFGIDRRVLWTTSHLTGSPELPPPYRFTRSFPALQFKEPVFIAQDPMSERFMVAEYTPGKIFQICAPRLNGSFLQDSSIIDYGLKDPHRNVYCVQALLHAENLS